MSNIRLGYVGCGFMAQKVHLPNFLSIPACDVVALAEVRPRLGKMVQTRLGIPKLYADHMAMLADPDIDAVAVSASFAVQGDIARDALLAGKDVFMEKPMAVSLTQADSILAAEQQSGRRLMVGYMKRFDAGNELVKAKLEAFRASNELGAITYVRNHGFCGEWIAGLDTPRDISDEPIPEAVSHRPDWLPSKYFDQYISYLQQYTHNFNLVRWFLGVEDAVQVRAVDLDDDGYSGLVILDVGGTRVVIESGRVSHYRWDEHTQIYFQHGWIKTWAPPILLKQTPAEVEIYQAGDEQVFSRPIPQPVWSWSYKREAEHFIHCLQNGAPFRATAQDTRTDVRLFEAIFRAYLQGRGIL